MPQVVLDHRTACPIGSRQGLSVEGDLKGQSGFKNRLYPADGQEPLKTGAVSEAGRRYPTGSRRFILTPKRAKPPASFALSGGRPGGSFGECTPGHEFSVQPSQGYPRRPGARSGSSAPGHTASRLGKKFRDAECRAGTALKKAAFTLRRKSTDGRGPEALKLLKGQRLGSARFTLRQDGAAG